MDVSTLCTISTYLLVIHQRPHIIRGTPSFLNIPTMYMISFNVHGMEMKANLKFYIRVGLFLGPPKLQSQNSTTLLTLTQTTVHTKMKIVFMVIKQA